MSRFVYEVQMRWGDMDAYQHVNNTAYLTYVEQARVAMFYDNPELAAHEFAGGVVIAKHEVDYLKPVTYHPEPLRIELWISHLGGASLTVVQEVYDGDVLACRVTSVSVRFDFAAGVPTRMTPEEREALSKYFEDAA